MKNSDFESVVIVDDDDNEVNDNNDNNGIACELTNNINELDNIIEIVEQPVKKSRTRTKQVPLKKYYSDYPNVWEIGVDEVGRGPLFGRVYTAAVILPKDDTFDHSKMKDSKKFHSKKKIEEVADYIKQNALAWSVSYETEKTIDDINILQATQKCMHNSIVNTYKKFITSDFCVTNGLKNNLSITHNFKLLVDGNYFNYLTIFDKNKNTYEKFNHTCVEGGDNKYSAIAAASILAKVSRDEYIDQLCSDNPYLGDYYGIDSNKGYGAKRHIDGIKEHGITVWHRRTFGICKEYCD